MASFLFRVKIDRAKREATELPSGMRMSATSRARVRATPSTPVATAPTGDSRSTSTARPVAHAAVGGRLIPGTLHAVRVPGRDVDVLLPHGTSFGQYVAALQKCGAFTAQDAALITLATNASQTSATTTTTAADPRPTVGIVLSEPRMLAPGAHANTEILIALVDGMGCRPVLIPPCADLTVAGTARQRAIAAMAKSLDGLIGPGGADVDPSLYGEKNTASVHTNPLRDRFEADFTQVALDGDLFAFGICRSHQLWNAAAGGSLIQDVESEAVVSVSHRDGHHPIEVDAKSMLHEEVRQKWLRVNSLHHQAVDMPGWGFRAVGHSHDDKTGKAMIEATERWNGITTQFHPELMQNVDAQQTLMQTVGRRAHIFAAMKAMPSPSLHALLDHVKNDARYEPSDVAWVQRELSRRLPR
jgi:putative glutamine amidotransferase